MPRNNPKPTDKLDWISDDTTNILEPLPSKKATGWLFGEKPPNNVFNFITNWLNRKTDYHAAQVEDWIVIDSDADEGDYATLVAWEADAPATNDRILVKEDQTITAQFVFPDNVTIKFLDGARLLCATNIATSVLKLGNNPIIEGVLNIVLSQTGTTAKAVEIDGDNAVGKINVENSSTGILTTGYHINANKTGNRVNGFVQNTGGGTLTNRIIDNSTEDSNLIILFDETDNSIKTNGKAFVDLLNNQDVAGNKVFTGVRTDIEGILFLGKDGSGNTTIAFYDDTNDTDRSLIWNDTNERFELEDNAGAVRPIATTTGAQTFTDKILGVGTKIALGSDADGDIYYRDAGILKRLAKGTDGKVLELASGLPSWQTRPNASISAKGIVELATNAETQTGADTTRAVTPAGLASKLPLLTKVIDIGDWNINESTGGGDRNTTVAHGLTLSKIRSVSAMIRNDTDTAYYDINHVAPDSNAITGGIPGIDATIVNLTAASGGFFDTSAFDSTSYNRGWITITYIP